MYNDTLTEVAKGKVGKGLLIENDGYISINSKENKKIFESIGVINEDGQVSISPKSLPNPFVVSAVFQKFGIENANGRVYPEHILKREVEKYQQAIRERRAYGECYTPDAECLTEDGWKSIVDIKEGDNVLTMNTVTMNTQIQKVSFKTEKEWHGSMIHLKGSFIDDIVTPDHQFPVYAICKDIVGSKNGAHFYGFMSAKKIFDMCKNYHGDDRMSYFIPCDQEPSLNKYGDNTKRIYILGRELQAEEIDYDGTVYCIEVPNHTWYVRQNGCTHWTKNCNHPETSSIDLSRVAMNIIELHWEGHTLVGKLEIPISEGFRNMGIVSTCADQVAQWIVSGLKIGVSSRALGSVTQVMGKLIVGDDLEIICWDVVSCPSTPNAWIETSDDKLQPYIESKQKDDTKLMNEDKFSKFDSWLCE